MNYKLKQAFTTLFNEEGILYFSPGRVNLIGEHIDYHGGYVLPAAISLGTYGVANKRKDKLIKVYSEGFSDEIFSFSLEDITKQNDWLDYIKGVFVILQNEGFQIPNGLNLYLSSTLPAKSGLSSSSSLELLIITILNDVFDLGISKTRSAELGKLVENNFIGVNSGIMDQFAIAHGKKDHALFLNSSTLEFKYVPIKLKGYDFVIINTNKARELAGSKYNERYSESMKALGTLKAHFPINYLVDLDVKDLSKAKDILNNNLLYRRVKHVVTEQNRTISAFRAMENNDIAKFGELLYASHDSLRDYYEVTGAELDLIVNVARQSGAVGARMTGAGFGGCAILLTKKDDTARITEKINNEYTKTFKFSPSFFTFQINDGTKKEDQCKKLV